MEMLWTLCSSKIFHHTHDTDHYSSNGNERPPQTEQMIGLGGDLEFIFSFYLLDYLQFNFSKIDILKKIEKKIQVLFFGGRGRLSTLFDIWVWR
jgi:hypothetical protein